MGWLNNMIMLWFLSFLPVVMCTAASPVPCHCIPVGVNDAQSIKPNRLASSGEIYSHLNAKHARFNDSYAWCPRRSDGSGCECPQNCSCNPHRHPCHGSDPFLEYGHRCHTLPNCRLPEYCQRLMYEEWLEVDLRRVKIVCGVATQGQKGISDWAAYYKVKLSINAREWDFYHENGTQKVFKGNADNASVVRHFFQSPTRARLVRFYPQKRKTKLSCMRVEVFIRKERVLRTRTVYKDGFVGGTLRLPCFVRGTKPSVTWLKDDKPLTIKKDVRQEIIVLGDLMNSNLVVPYVTYQHEGVYTCRTKDSPCSRITKTHTYDVKLYVNIRDRMDLLGNPGPVLKAVNNGKQLILKCTARFRQQPLGRDGFWETPIPLVTWVKDLRLVNTSRAQKTDTVRGATIASTLVVSPVRCHDEGMYRCIMINYRFPKQWLEKKFQVKVLNKKLLSRRKSLRVPRNVWTNGTLRLSCKAQGNPIPIVTWFKDGEPVIDRRVRVIRAMNVSTIKIFRVTCQDSGTYHCLIEGTQYCPFIEKTFPVRVLQRSHGERCQTKEKPKPRQEQTRKDYEKSWMKYFDAHPEYDFMSFCRYLEWSRKYSCSQDPFS